MNFLKWKSHKLGCLWLLLVTMETLFNSYEFSKCLKLVRQAQDSDLNAYNYYSLYFLISSKFTSNYQYKEVYGRACSFRKHSTRVVWNREWKCIGVEATVPAVTTSKSTSVSEFHAYICNAPILPWYDYCGLDEAARTGAPETIVFRHSRIQTKYHGNYVCGVITHVVCEHSIVQFRIWINWNAHHFNRKLYSHILN